MCPALAQRQFEGNLRCNWVMMDGDVIDGGVVSAW